MRQEAVERGLPGRLVGGPRDHAIHQFLNGGVARLGGAGGDIDAGRCDLLASAPDVRGQRQRFSGRLGCEAVERVGGQRRRGQEHQGAALTGPGPEIPAVDPGREFAGLRSHDLRERHDEFAARRAARKHGRDELGASLPRATAGGYDGHAETRREFPRVDRDARGHRHVPLIESDDDAAPRVDHLRDEQQAALDVRGVGHHDHDLGRRRPHATEDLVPCDHLVRGPRSQAVAARKVDGGDRAGGRGNGPHHAFDGDPGVVADALAQSGQCVEERGLTDVRVAAERHAVGFLDQALHPDHRSANRSLGLQRGPPSVPS